MRRAGLLLVTVVVLAILVVTAAPASASCAGRVERVLDDVDVLFVGQVRESGDTHATLAVREIWQGPDLAPEVGVATGQEQPAWPANLFTRVGSSGDVHLTEGETYLVGATHHFTTNVCLVAEFGNSSIAATLRPHDLRRPVADGLGGVDAPLDPWVPTLGTALGAALAVGALLGWRRRRS